MISNLKENILQEKKIVDAMRSLDRQIQISDQNERGFYEESFKSLKRQLVILNDSIPGLLGGVVGTREYGFEKRGNGLSKVDVSSSQFAFEDPNSQFGFRDNKIAKTKSLAHPPSATPNKLVKSKLESSSSGDADEDGGGFVTINKEDRARFMQETGATDISFKKFKKMQAKKTTIQKPSQLASISNKVFGGFSESIAGKFSGVKQDLKQANIRFSISTYISMALLVSLLVFVVSLVGWGLLLVVGVAGLLQFWVVFLLVFLTLVGFYFYPASEKSSVQKRVSNELPFATIHMAAIAGSNLEPTRIFKIIANSPEYPTVGLEMKKIVNQVEIYGYDLVNALRNATKNTPNSKLADLYSGLATNIISGGDLKDYLEQKADNFLRDYKLERKKYTAIAETFMDIYISVLITAPLILVVMLIVMNVTGLDVGLGFGILMGLIIGGIVLINIIFLVVIEMKQPKV